MQPVIYPRKPMPYCPPRYMDYLGKPAVFWRHGRRVEYLYMAEHPVWANQKRLTTNMIAAEMWRAALDHEITGDPTIEKELHTWERFAKNQHAFEGGTNG